MSRSLATTRSLPDIRPDAASRANALCVSPVLTPVVAEIANVECSSDIVSCSAITISTGLNVLCLALLFMIHEL